ncbi:MAG: nuclease family protein, partial [Gammaproteobacteria bacterium]|nr:nuclease family protein [Gammaproteobacteria bacterium]
NALMQQWTDKIVLTSEQELAVWEQIINAQPRTTALLSKSYKTAQLAQKAWELVQHWQLPISTLEHSHHSETEQFLSWLYSFKKTLEAHDWLSLAELPLHLSQHLPIAYCQTMPVLHLVGFDEIPPVIRGFLDILQQCGVNVNICAIDKGGSRAAPTGSGDTRAYKLNCKNRLEELKLALCFAQNELKKNNQARIGIVVPELAQQRNTIVSLCQKLFYPDAPFQEPENNPFVNISGGIPLSDTLLVQSVFSALKITSHHIAIPDLYWLWHSPYFNFGTHNATRPLLEQRLCHEYNKYISHDTLIRFLNKELPLENVDSLPFYTALKAPPSHNPSAKSHHTWTQIIQRYLVALGFPGQRSLVSSDVQRIRAFEEVLRTFESLDRVKGKISFEEALTELQYLCLQKMFQAKTHDAPIQVLELLEASGLEYTHLWITGLNEGVFPSNPHPTPLLPISIQKKMAMPRADAAREFSVAQKLLTRLLTHSDYVICSYSEENNDIHLRPSPLIATLPLFNRTELSWNLEEKTPPQLKTEYVDDRHGLSLVTTDAPVQGGSNLFKLQAQCPFKSYATLRLRAKENNYPGLGLTPALRGTAVHAALHSFYQDICSQSQLLTLSKEEQHQLLQKACQSALNQLHEQQPPSEYSRHYSLELARLEKLLSLWLEQEKMRPHFTVIATEKRLEAHFAGLQFRVTIDRIDKLDDGSEIIIDYKTGQVNIQDWFSERPNEPQLPLYCSIYDSDISAMAFAKVTLQKIGMEGIGAINDEWPAIKRLTFTTVEGADSWQQQKALWREQLALLADEFKEGYAAVTPKEGACNYCHLPSLCRIHLHQNMEKQE